MEDLNVDLLISLIEQRPIIWDKTLNLYRDKKDTQKAWIEVFIELRSDFLECGTTEKNDFSRAVMKRWVNVRDAFKKSCNKDKEAKKSGAGAANGKPYIYDKQLQFLMKVYEERQTENSLTDRIAEAGAANAAGAATAGAANAANVDTLGPRKRKLDPVEIEMVKAIKEKPDRHLSFFKGISPSLASFDEDEILEFQMEVLSTITSIKRRRNMRSTSIGSNQQETPASGSQHYHTMCPPMCSTPNANKSDVLYNPFEISDVSFDDSFDISI